MLAKINNIKTGMNRNLYKIEGKVRKNSPEILLGMGLVSMVASTVVACKSTTKAFDVMENSNKSMDEINKVLEKRENGEITEDTYSDKDAQKDKLLVAVQTGAGLFKVYSPAIGLGVLGVLCILKSHNIQKERLEAVSAAYLGVNIAFKEYRNRVKNMFGDEVDEAIRYNLKVEEIEKETVDEKGKKKKEKETKKTSIDLDCSPYARFFDECNPMWKRSPEANRYFLESQEIYCNELLRIKGRLFLNDVYNALCIEPTKAGQVVGWTYDPSGDNPNGDNYISFGMKTDVESYKRFIDGAEPSILLDFNVDGNIWENM